MATDIHRDIKRTNIDLTLDYHAHILPGCDHGSDSTETSLRQIEMALEAGIGTICATPHFYPHKENIDAFLRRREASAEVLFRALPVDAPKILLGAEVLICDGMDRMEGLTKLCLTGRKELLLEMPFHTWQKALWDTLYKLHARDDITVIIAHAERYPAENIEKLIDHGLILQLNTGCLTKMVHRRRYLDWIKNGYVKYLGSDIHMLGDGYRDWKKCRKVLGKIKGN